MTRKQLSLKKRKEIYSRDNYTCVYCGFKGLLSELTLDHVIPVSAKGSNTTNNLVTSCKPCNTSKGNSILADTSMLPVHGEYAKVTKTHYKKHPNYCPPTPEDLWPGIWDRQFNLSKAQQHILNQAIHTYCQRFAQELKKYES